MSINVSIIISAFNAEKYIEQTLQSVLAQTWQAIEIIVVNDGSTDSTGRILEQYKNRVKVIDQLNKGQDAALNEGFRHSTGDYIKFMDSDDLINPEMIEKQMKILNQSDKYVAYGEWARFYDDDLSKSDFKKLSYWKDMNPVDFLTAMPEGVMLQCAIMLIPRKLVEIAGLWDERLILYNDTEFFNRIILASSGVKFSAGARLYYRSGISGSISAQRSKKFFESTLLATDLIAEQLLRVEDSFRVRNLIANTYKGQYYLMYPLYPELSKQYKERIAQYPEGSVKPSGGKVFELIKTFFGWKMAKLTQRFFYKIGYVPVPPNRT